jgi:hypothetical protein
MTDRPDSSLADLPTEHRAREDQFIQHVQTLLGDDRLRLDTTRGRRAVTTLITDVSPSDRSVDLTRLMSEMNKPDRAFRDRMPAGRCLDVTLSRQRFFLFRQPVGRLWVTCASPARALVAGQTPPPLSRAELSELLRQVPAPRTDVPTTIVVMSTSGFALEANELADRRTDRTVILAAPNAAGGWTITGPPESKGLADLFDPEADAEKRGRVRQVIEDGRADLGGAGLASDRIAAKASLPLTLVESELKQYAKENAGLAARRLDGKMVLFRESAAPPAAAGGVGIMPMIDKMKALFARKGETEKKIAFLAERRAALSQQRDRGYEEMSELESREADLRRQFKEATADLPKRRITTQLLQLRKDLERRQQLLGMLNQQVNVVATHLHNLELVRQGKTAQLPNSDEMAHDAAAAEDTLAELQASTELAESVGSTMHSGMSAEEQALFDELEKSSAAPAESAPAEAPQEIARPQPTRAPDPPQRKATPEAG